MNEDLIDITYDRMRDEQFEDDDGYREWSETIEKQNLRRQIEEDSLSEDSLCPIDPAEYRGNDYGDDDVQIIDLSHLPWSEVLTKLLPTAEK